MKILIAEDDENSRLLLEALLLSHGHSVVSVCNGVLGARSLCESVPDLIVSDILMPELDGFGLLRFVRNTESLRRVPFIIYSATYIEDEDREFAMTLGADRFIVKPYEVTDLVCVIEEVYAESVRGWTDERQERRASTSSLSGQHLSRVQSKLDKKLKELETERLALRDSERRFRDFAESAGDFFWETDRELVIRFASGAGGNMVGQPLSEVFSGRGETAANGMLTLDGNAMQALALEQRFQNCLVEWKGRLLVDTQIFKLSGKPYYDHKGLFAGYRGVASDVTSSMLMERELRYLASHDALTGLMNRTAFEKRLSEALMTARNHGKHHAICYVDLDQFKVVNDTAGHAAGDDLLKCIADVIRRAVRSHDTVARFGGDEFALLLEDCPIDKAVAIANNVVSAVTQFRFSRAGRTFETGASIGVVAVTRDADSATSLLTQADVACYTAKDRGRRRVHLYEGDATKHMHLELHRAAEIGELLRGDRFCLYTQPIVPVGVQDTRERFEVLLRLVEDNGSIVSPKDCISAAERYGTITSIDRWVIGQSFGKIKAIAGNSDSVFMLNVSGHSVSDPTFPGYVREQILDVGIDTGRICFEITETSAFTNPGQAACFVDEMSTLGCGLALDDFGTGVSSLTYLKNLKVDYLKIDGSFVRDVAVDPIDAAMVAMIHQLGKVMNLHTIAESVDSETVHARLKALAVDYGQGYALGMPQLMGS